MTESIESQKSPKNLNTHNYNYERFKKTLKNLICATNNIKIGQLSYGLDDFTIAIDAPWGAGKSFLIHDFQEYIKNDKNIKTVIYNAWEDDQSQDPLFGLTMSIINAYSKKEGERISKIVKSLLRCVLVQGISLIKYYSYGSIDMRNILHEIQQEWNNNTKDYIAEFQDKNKKINTIFKETISELIRGGKSKQERDTKKLVIFIDELDRCKPNFAIQVLERVKHFFDIEGRQLIFVFAIDKEQLQRIIEHFYGKINSDKYLQKFFSFQLKLPYNSPEFFKAIVANYDFHNKPMNYRELLINMDKINYSGGLEFLLSHDATPRDLICFCREISRKCEAIEELGMPHEDACYQERQLHIIMWHYFLV